MHYLLPFDNAMRLIEEGIALLPEWVIWQINVEEYVMYLLEWLSDKITDHEATSASHLAAAYLKSCHVDEEFALAMSHHVMDEVFSIVVSYLPDITYDQLARSRYVLERDRATLSVYTDSHAKVHY